MEARLLFMIAVIIIVFLLVFEPTMAQEPLPTVRIVVTISGGPPAAPTATATVTSTSAPYATATATSAPYPNPEPYPYPEPDHQPFNLWAAVRMFLPFIVRR